MSGTREGALKMVETLKAKLGGEEAYNQWRKDNSRKGGSTVTDKPRGFAAMELSKLVDASRKGGKASRRPSKGKSIDNYNH